MLFLKEIVLYNELLFNFRWIIMQTVVIITCWFKIVLIVLTKEKR